jgi:hypothetical protein
LPRISLYRENRSNDYKFQDSRILELFTMSGVGINVHKYLGPAIQTNTNNATLPTYENVSERNIQDLLFLENRDRKYDADVYALRGHYTIQDNDFNLSQFGMFLSNDTIYVTMHINDMVGRVGRKIIAGDVFELPNMRDFWPLDDSIPAALRKFYVVQETTRAAEGYAQTWLPHLWRCKCVPMVDGQEFREILDNVTENSGDITLRDMISAYTRNLEINTAVVQQAESDVPLSGYDTANLFVLPLTDTVSNTNTTSVTADTDIQTADNTYMTTDLTSTTPITGMAGYLTGSDLAPNGHPVTADVAFPSNPFVGQYVLRLDYFPNRMFRYDGIKWVAIQDSVRQPITGDRNTTQRGTFVNNNAKTRTNAGNLVDQRQALSKLLKPQADQ